MNIGISVPPIIGLVSNWSGYYNKKWYRLFIALPILISTVPIIVIIMMINAMPTKFGVE